MRKSPYAGMYFNGQGRPIDINGYANTLPASMGGNKTPFIDEDHLYGEARQSITRLFPVLDGPKIKFNPGLKSMTVALCPSPDTMSFSI